MKEIRERGRERGGQEKRKEGEINLRQRDRRLINREMECKRQLMPK